MTQAPPTNRAKVSVSHKNGEWLVTVLEGDGELYTQGYPEFEWAMNYAEGQRIRLGLDLVELLDTPIQDESAIGGASLSDEHREELPKKAATWAMRNAATTAAAEAIIKSEVASRREKTDDLRKARLAKLDQPSKTGSKPQSPC